MRILPLSEYDKKKSFIDKDFAFDIMSQAYSNGTREIGFYIIGEPFLNRDLEEYISYAQKLGFEYIYLTTNGALASPDRMAAVIKAGLNSIKFSVNAATPQSYKFIHGVDDYEKVKNNVRQLHNYIYENKINLAVFVSFVKTEVTENDIESLHRDFKPFVDKIYVEEPMNQGMPMKDLINQGIVKKFKPWFFPCDMIFNRIHVTCEGFLNACCNDVNGFLNVCDLHKMSLLDAWNSDIMTDLRKQFVEKNLRKDIMCYNCINNTQDTIRPLNPVLYNMVQAESPDKHTFQGS